MLLRLLLELAGIEGLGERAASAEGELRGLREAMARDVRQLEQAEEARRTAETQRDAAQAARDATQAE